MVLCDGTLTYRGRESGKWCAVHSTVSPIGESAERENVQEYYVKLLFSEEGTEYAHHRSSLYTG